MSTEYLPFGRTHSELFEFRQAFANHVAEVTSKRFVDLYILCAEYAHDICETLPWGINGTPLPAKQAHRLCVYFLDGHDQLALETSSDKTCPRMEEYEGQLPETINVWANVRRITDCSEWNPGSTNVPRRVRDLTKSRKPAYKPKARKPP